MITKGGFSVHDQWNEGGWSKIDAITLIVSRIYIIMFIVSIVISIIALFTVNKAVKSMEHFR